MDAKALDVDQEVLVRDLPIPHGTRLRGQVKGRGEGEEGGSIVGEVLWSIEERRKIGGGKWADGVGG